MRVHTAAIVYQAVKCQNLAFIPEFRFFASDKITELEQDGYRRYNKTIKQHKPAGLSYFGRAGTIGAAENEDITMKRILFSCVGTTDPVRGEHDGPMLHILRHYHPEKVWIFLTPEIRELGKSDDRFEKTRRWICEHWNGYCPEFHYIDSNIRNAHDIDALYLPLRETMAQLSREKPDAEILINLSSGTPQMQMILSQFAMDTRYHTRGIQVSNFERSSGKSQRANDKEYFVELELECNEDEQPDAENRCIEPEMFAIRREHLRKQITALLDARDFDAVEELRDSLPENLGNLISHLAARNRLQGTEAWRLAGLIKDLPFKLYAYKSGSREGYNAVSEYYLMMNNLVKAGNCTEFLLHLEPLTLTLQMAILNKLMQGTGYRIEDFLLMEKNRLKFDPFQMKSALPELYAHYEQTIARSWEVRVNEISTYVCNDLLSYYPDVPEKAKSLFIHYDLLKDLRNQLAHTLCAVTAEDVKTACGVEATKLLEEIEATIIIGFPVCDPVVFSVYDKSIEYIKSSL